LTDPKVQENEVISFLRKRDYRFVRELGQGACGKTVLLYDDQIEEYFVCKKYLPYEVVLVGWTKKGPFLDRAAG
jgi:serine/threonine-protein kinase